VDQKAEKLPRVIPRKKVIKLLWPGMQLKGKVRRITSFGAFVDIGVGTDGLVPRSEIRLKPVKHPSEVVSVGDEVTVWITDLDRERNRISLTMIDPDTPRLRDLQPGQICTGVVTRLEPYGAFVDIGVEREGLLHVREMAEGYIPDPAEILSVGETIEVRVLRVDRRRRKLEFTIKGLYPEEEEKEEEEEHIPTVMELALQEALNREEERARRAKRRKKKKKAPTQTYLDEIIQRTLQLQAEQEDNQRRP